MSKSKKLRVSPIYIIIYSLHGSIVLAFPSENKLILNTLKCKCIDRIIKQCEMSIKINSNLSMSELKETFLIQRKEILRIEFQTGTVELTEIKNSESTFIHSSSSRST